MRTATTLLLLSVPAILVAQPGEPSYVPPMSPAPLLTPYAVIGNNSDLDGTSFALGVAWTWANIPLMQTAATYLTVDPEVGIVKPSSGNDVIQGGVGFNVHFLSDPLGVFAGPSFRWYRLTGTSAPGVDKNEFGGGGQLGIYVAIKRVDITGGFTFTRAFDQWVKDVRGGIRIPLGQDGEHGRTMGRHWRDE